MERLDALIGRKQYGVWEGFHVGRGYGRVSN